ncbi:translin family protein [Thermococcus thioreducens]|uniref:Haloacid dehalogenase n=1 Tax=Thermococcus thioreducens TaxID=277988 RepID=A0A0Q2M4V2_9EURY|nr:haloacid dehalogenase [Thermococcus thioreducens]ASJ12318.1 haloacid dehalogenase [Thermococcus thioreducens]KQH83049.1 haloacid dehalogenase [Thermococcus thioreducens]SEV92917.1 translin [Thermococcus thioreducens]
MGLKEIISEIREVLDEKDALREEALRLTREIVRLSGDAIKALHRGEMAKAEERLKLARRKVEELSEKLREHPDLYHSGYVQNAHQEFVEATLFLAYRTGRKFPSPQELGVPHADYALGIGDFIGELRRHFLLLLLDGNLDEAERTYRFMEEVYEDLMVLEYPKGLVNVRQKQDQARHILERTLEDLTRAKLSRTLEEKLEAVANDSK